MDKDVKYKDFFTNELLNKRFKNQFNLVRYAIQLAENAIRSGHLPPTQEESHNLAFQILAAIAEEKDSFEEIERETFLKEQDGYERKIENGASKFVKESKREVAKSRER